MLKTVSSVANAIGALNYKGTWNATTNTPTLASDVGTQGDYYVVSVAGGTDLNGITNWGIGDWATFNGSVWQRVEGGADGNFVNLTASGTTTVTGLSSLNGGADVTGNLDVTGDLATYGVNNLEGGYTFQRNYATWPYFALSRAQGTRASPATIGNGQTLSEIYFSGYTNGQYRNGARIQAKVSAGVVGDEIPTTLTFSTTADGANSPTDRWAINHTGNLVALQSGNGIDFSATAGTGTSELFNDYEEGTWTVTSIGGVTFTGSPTYTGIYTKIGRMVYVSLKIQATDIASVSGYISGGFPFVSANYFTTAPIVNTSSGADLGLGLIGLSGGNTIIYLPTFSGVTSVAFSGFYYV
jgi:hypothetical protein